jgi:hypothetical protein
MGSRPSLRLARLTESQDFVTTTVAIALVAGPDPIGV